MGSLSSSSLNMKGVHLCIYKMLYEYNTKEAFLMDGSL